jgi:hypothetical protein
MQSIHHILVTIAIGDYADLTAKACSADAVLLPHPQPSHLDDAKWRHRLRRRGSAIPKLDHYDIAYTMQSA